MNTNEAQPLVTAVIPTYRRQDFLLRALRSILRQTFTRFEIHVHDNDPRSVISKEIQELMNHDPRITYYRNERNLGWAKNFAKGVRGVNTPFFSILSDDDFLAPEFYEDALGIFKGYNDYSALGFVVMDTLIIDEHENLIRPALCNRELTFVDVRKPRISLTEPQTMTGMLFRSELKDLFVESALKSHEIGIDMLFIHRAKSRYSYVVFNKVGAVFTDHQQSYSSKRAFVEEGSSYFVVQLSRYVDIIHDKHAFEEQKAHYLKLLRSTLRRPLVFFWVKLCIFDIIKYYLEDPCSHRNETLERNLRSLRDREGHKLISMQLTFLYKSLFFKFLFRLFFLRIYNYTQEKRKQSLLRIKLKHFIHIISVK